MPGGVGGVASRGVPLSRSSASVGQILPQVRTTARGNLALRLAAAEWPQFAQSGSARSSKAVGAQHVRIKGRAVDLSPTDASASWDRRLASGFYPVSIFFSFWPSTRRRGQSCCRFFCARLAPADGARVGRRRLHFTIESSRGSLRRVERPSAAGTRNGSGRGRLHPARASFGSPFPSIGYEWTTDSRPI